MPTSDKPDAIALLKQDHRTVEELFEKFEKASDKERKQVIAEQICLELSIHAQIEEEIFYPACDGKVDEELLKESFVEHDGAKLLIAEIMAEGAGDDFYDAKVKVLQEQIEHHIQEEERRVDGLFSQARKADLDTEALGIRLEARKRELTEQFKARGVPTPELTTMSEATV